MAPSNPPPPTKGGGIMKKKIGPIPIPIAIGLVAIVGFLAYRHFKGSTASTSANQTGTDTTGTASPGADLGNSGVGGGSGATGAGSPTDTTGGTAPDSGTQTPSSFYYYFGSSPGVDNTAPTGANNSAPLVPTVTPALSPSSSVVGGSTGPAPMSAAAVAASEGFVQYPTLTSAQLSQSFQIGSHHPQGGPLPTVSVAAPPSTPGGYPTLNFGTPSKSVPSAPQVTIVNPTITANKTGGSANKKQGIYSIH